jgi:hypothetical protein
MIEAHALCLLGEICARAPGAGQPEAAERHYRAALSLAEEIGARPDAARSWLGLARLYRRTGRPELARESQAAASALLRAMNVPHWAEEDVSA